MAYELGWRPEHELEDGLRLTWQTSRLEGASPPEANPCDLKSSVDPTGRERSTYVPPPVLIA